MSEHYKKKALLDEIPQDFSKETVDSICRIDLNHHVVGVLYLENSVMRVSTIPESLSQTLVSKLPIMTEVVRNAISEIDVLDELLAYRIETKTVEVLVAPAGSCISCVVHRSRRKRKHKK